MAGGLVTPASHVGTADRRRLDFSGFRQDSTQLGANTTFKANYGTLLHGVVCGHEPFFCA